MKQSTLSVGNGNIVLNSVDGENVKFSFIVQTEGVHTDMSGMHIRYTSEVMKKYGGTIVGNGVYDDPHHSHYKTLSSEFATILDYEIKKINNDMVEKFGIDNSLLDKHALIAKANGYKKDYNNMIENNRIKFYSSEFEFEGEKGDDGIYDLHNVNYLGVVALSDPGADPGAVFLEIYNSKYGGKNKMADEEETTAEEETTEEEAPESAEGGENTESAGTEENATETELKEERVSNAKLAEEKKVLEEKVSELEVKNAELSKGEFSLETAEKEIEALNTKNKEYEEKVSKIEDMETQIEASNATIKEMRDEKREVVLKELVSNADIITKVIGQDLDDKAFNAKIEEIKQLKEEGVKSASGNNAGIGPGEIASNASDSFEKDWGMKQEDLIKNIVGG